MRLQDSQAEDPEINLTSLIDVVFLLLIFFMVTTTFERQARLKIELPEASEQAVSEPPEELVLVVSEDGRYYVNNNEVSQAEIESLKDALVSVVGNDRDQAVTIRADARTPHQAVVTAMDAVSQLGFVNLSIATVPNN